MEYELCRSGILNPISEKEYAKIFAPECFRFPSRARPGPGRPARAGEMMEIAYFQLTFSTQNIGKC